MASFGLDGNPSPLSSAYSYADRIPAIMLAKSTGITHWHYAPTWAELESSSGVFDWTDLDFVLAQTTPLKLAINLRVIDAGKRQMCLEYQGLAWDNPTLIYRLAMILSLIANRCVGRAWVVSVGNEVDTYFVNHQNEIISYGVMLSVIRPYVLSWFTPIPSFSVNFTSKAAGVLSTTYAPIHAQTTVSSFTYYPLNPDFTMQAPYSIVDAVYRMIAGSIGQPVFLQEIGYSTSPLCSSSDNQQADFIGYALSTVKSWSSYVIGATVLFQYDLPDWLLNILVERYNNIDQKFRAYLQTLGLRNAAGPKAAWSVLLAELAQ